MSLNHLKKIIILLSLIVTGETLIGESDTKLSDSILKGKKIYSINCASCHMQNGQGLPGVFPPLAKSDYLMKDFKRNVQLIINGMSGEIVVNGVTYNGVMSSFKFTNQEIADLLNYINNSWGNESPIVTSEKVEKAR